MSEAIFGKYFHIRKANTNPDNSAVLKNSQFFVVTFEMGC